MKNKHNIGIIAVLCVWLALALIAWCKPSRDVSAWERRKLAQLPAVSGDSLLSGKFMSDFEAYTLDQFPARDQFRQLKSLFHYFVLRQGDNNGIYLADGTAAKLDMQINQASVSHAIEHFNSIYTQYLEGNAASVHFAIVPDKSFYLAQANGYPAMDYALLFDDLQESLPWAEFTDLTDCLTAQDYYRTDTHWRQERLEAAAARLWDALEIPAGEGYTASPVPRDFYGVYYGQAALPMEAETMYVLHSDVIDGCTVYNHETGKTTGIYDWDKLESRDLYDVFLSGAASLLTIENPAADSDRELIVFRDSFGSSMVPLLVQGYRTVTLADTRYIPAAMLGDYLSFEGKDVLFLYSTLILNSSSTLR